MLSMIVCVQVTVLNTAKQMLTHQIDDECLQRHKSEAEHRDLLKKHQSVKQNMEVCAYMLFYNASVVLHLVGHFIMCAGSKNRENQADRRGKGFTGFRDIAKKFTSHSG